MGDGVGNTAEDPAHALHAAVADHDQVGPYFVGLGNQHKSRVALRSVQDRLHAVLFGDERKGLKECPTVVFIDDVLELVSVAAANDRQLIEGRDMWSVPLDIAQISQAASTARRAVGESSAPTKTTSNILTPPLVRASRGGFPPPHEE